MAIKAYRALRDNFLYFLVLNGGIFQTDSEGSRLEDNEEGEALGPFLTFTLLPIATSYSCPD